MRGSLFVELVMESAAKESATPTEGGFARILFGFTRIFLRCFGDKKKKEEEKEGEKEGEKQGEGEKTKRDEKKNVQFMEEGFGRIFPKNCPIAMEDGFTRIFLPSRQRVGGGTGDVRARFETVYPKMASVKVSTVFASAKLADDSITTLSNPKLPTDVYVDGVFQGEEEHSLFESDECESDRERLRRLALLRKSPKRLILKYTTRKNDAGGGGSSF
jgi:hypothetical protein